MQDQTSDIDILIEQLLELRDLHEQLLHVVRNKQRCMRSGDMDRVQSWSARETFLVESIRAGDAGRRETIATLAEPLDVDRPVTVSRLAERVHEPHRSKLLALAGATRNLAEQIYQVNQVNDAVTREILHCFAHMQREFAASQSDIGLYDPNGQRCLTPNVSILDAVG